MPTYVIGIDLGTQGTKVAVFDEKGNCVGSGFRASTLIQPQAGVTEEDPDDQFLALQTAITAAMEQSQVNPSHVAALAIAGQMAGIMGIDAQGKHITSYDSWLDTRCAPYISEMTERAGTEITRLTGHYPSYNHGPKILWWKHQRASTYDRITSFIQPAAYLAMRLGGLKSQNAFIDRTYLHFSGFADSVNSRWAESLCEQFAIESNKLPRIVEPESIVGYLTAEMARRFGLQQGLPIVAGCGDSTASFLAAGAVTQGICIDIAGTASVFAGTTSEMIGDTGSGMLGCGQSVLKGLWHPYAYLNGGGLNIEWWRKEIAGLRSSDSISHTDLDVLAAAILPTNDDPVFLPYLGGRVCPADPFTRGAWLNLNWSHTAMHLYRAILESVAYEYTCYLHELQLADILFQPTEIKVTGGGSRSALWNQLKADILQLPVSLPSRQSGAAMGAAMVAGKGVGLFPDLRQTASDWSTPAEIISPDISKASLFTQKAQAYREWATLITTRKIRTNKLFTVS